MALPETIVWTYILYMVIPLLALLVFWIIGLIRDARKKAKKRARSEPEADAESG